MRKKIHSNLKRQLRSVVSPRLSWQKPDQEITEEGISPNEQENVADKSHGLAPAIVNLQAGLQPPSCA